MSLKAPTIALLTLAGAGLCGLAASHGPAAAFDSGQSATTADAAAAPADLRDMVGMRANEAEGQLRARGYRFVRTEDGERDDDAFWWNSTTQQCVKIDIDDGRYETIQAVAPAFCQ